MFLSSRLTKQTTLCLFAAIGEESEFEICLLRNVGAMGK